MSSLGLLLWLTAPARADWVEDHYPALLKAVGEVGLSNRGDELESVHAEVEAAGAITCDVASGGFSFWDRKCVGSVASHDAELCAGLAVVAVLETRLRDLYAGNDRATELTLTCGSYKAVAGARRYVSENWNDGRVEVKVRATTDSSDADPVYSGSSGAVAGWSAAPPDQRLDPALEALGTYGEKVLGRRAGVDAAMADVATALGENSDDLQLRQNSLLLAAGGAEAGVLSEPVPDGDLTLQKAAIAYYDVVIAFCKALDPVVAWAHDESRHAEVQAILDAEQAKLTAADKTYQDAILAYAKAKGF